ncbi:MAG TPA: hypothetical protein VF456_02575 [Vicinamibacterales bacterium]
MAAAPTTTPAATTTAAAVTQRSTGERAVRDVLGRYASAYRTLNVGAAKAVWPSVDEKALGRAFAGLESQAIYFTDCQVSVVIVSAKAHCMGTAQFTPKVGNKTQHLETREWTFDFQKTGEQWTIAHVDVH